MFLCDAPGITHLESFEFSPSDVVEKRSSLDLKYVEQFVYGIDILTFLFVVYFHRIPLVSFR